MRVEGGENLQEVALMKGGGAGDGYGLVACGEQTPAVGASFGNIERLAGFQEVQDGKVIDGALGALRELEPRGLKGLSRFAV